MSHHQGGDAEYLADEYEMEDIEDDMDGESIDRERGDVESDVDEFDYSVSSMLFLIVFFFVAIFAVL